MKMKLDLSKFKLGERDDKKATLHHPDGHTIHIAINALHPENRKNLDKLEKHNPKLEESKKSPKKLADGGEVSETAIKKENYGKPKYGSKVEDEDEVLPPADDSQTMPAEKPKKMADGGSVEDLFSKNSSSVNDEAPEPIEPTSEASVPVPLPPGYAKPESSDTPSDYSGVKRVGSSIGDFASALGAGFKGAPLPEASESAPIPGAQSLAPESSPVRAPALSAPPAPVAPPAGNPDPMGLGKQQSMTEAGFTAGQEGIAQEQKAQQQLGQAKAEQAQSHINQFQAIDSQFKAKSDQTMQQIDHVIHDYKEGHINPNHFMESKSALGRVSTAIGLIIGGLGGGVGDFLNKQIDRDIDAQRANLDKNNNILAAYQHQFGNLKEATDMAKLTQVGLYGAQLDKAAADAATPEAKARASQAKSQLYQQYAPLMQRFAMNQMISQAARSGGDPSQLLPYLRIQNPEMAKEMETRMVPGSGPKGQAEMASVPLSEGARQDILAKTDLIRATQNLRDWTAKHGTSLDKLNPAVRAEGETLINELQGKYRKGVGASTSEGEQKLINEVTGANPAGFLASFRTSPKLKALEESIGSSLNTTRRQYGLPVHETSSIREQTLSPVQSKMLEAARKNPSHPNAKLILKKLGIE